MPQNPYAQLLMITPRAIHDTVLFDGQIRLWFSRLCAVPEVARKLMDLNPETAANLHRYRWLSTLALALITIAAILMTVTAFAFAAHPFISTVGTLIALTVAGVCLLKRRTPLAKLAASLIEADQANIPPGLTLYQLGEKYARTYRIPSLVDTIWLWDHWLRNAFLLIYAAAFGVFFLPFWKMVIVTCLGCGVVVLMVKAAIMAQRPKAVKIQAAKK